MLRSSIDSDRRRLFRAVGLASAFYGTFFLILFASPFPFLARTATGIIPVGAASGPAASFRSVHLTLSSSGGSAGGSGATDGIPAEGSPAPAVLPRSTIEQKIIVQPEIVPASASSNSAVIRPEYIGNLPAVPETTDTSETASDLADERLPESSASEMSGASGGSGSADSYGFTGNGFLPEGVRGNGRFVSWIDGAIRKKLSYPERARRRNIEGSVIVALSVPADGSRCETSILESSGSSILDDAAQNLLKSLFPTPVSPEKEFHSPVKIQYRIFQD